jgi:beta-lactam-binding protein with PASTA domain
MRQFFRMLLLALVLLTVALVSALTAMRFAIHGREVTVPRLTGMTPLEAERAAAAFGLEVVVERQFYSSDTPEGRILSQVPLPAVKVRRGWAIRVAQSLGPQRVAIPDVTSESERVAELNVRRRGLDLGSIAQVKLPDVAADQVVSQSPPAKASGVSVPKINLLVSRGPEPAAYVMPNFVGQPLGSVMLALQDAGVRVGRVSVAATSPPADMQATPTASSPASLPAPLPAPQPGAASMIVNQNPAPGKKIVAGSAVDFEVR